MATLLEMLARSNDTIPVAGLADDCVETQAPSINWRKIAHEEDILAIIVAAPQHGERIEFAFRRKELELMQLMAQLSITDVFELTRRLTMRLEDDVLATRFHERLANDRRNRLMAFLRDARRRDAILRRR